MRRIGLLLVVILMTLSIFAAVQAQTDVSTGCAATEQLTLTRSGTGVITYGPQDFLEGEELTFMLASDDPDSSYSVYANTDLIATIVTVGSGVVYTIPADGTYTFLFPIESSGLGTATYDIALDCESVAQTEDPFRDGPPYPICHYPPGNPDNAHTITVGSMNAVEAHFGHGDTAGPCAENVESRFDGSDGSYIIFVGNEDSEIYGDCDGDSCKLIALIDIQLLIDLNGTQDATEFDEDPTDEWTVIVYFLGFQDRDGDGESVAVYQINVYRSDSLWDDNVLILIDSDGSVAWETNDDATPEDGDED